MYPYELLDDIPDNIWDYVESFFQYDCWCEENYL